MKWLFVLFFSFTLLTNIFSQTKLIVINPEKDILSSIPTEDIYAYAEFVDGSIHKKNGKSIQRKMNYHILFDRMQYSNSAGDTLDVDDDSFEFIVLEKDTFYHSRFYYRVLKDYDKIRLVSRNVFVFLNMQKTSTGSYYNSYQVINNGHFLRGISPKDTVLLTKAHLYYMADVKNNIQTLHRENLIEIYPHRKKALLNYLYEHTVNLNNLDEIEKMLNFLTTKK